MGLSQCVLTLPPGNKCYKVKVFTSSSAEGGSVTWDEAVEECRAGPGLNPDLASVDSEVENSIIMSQIQGHVFGAWIGLHRDLTGQHVWSDNSDLGYQNWRVGSPESGDCVEMHSTEDAGTDNEPGKWRSLECSTLRGYACQTYKGD